MQKKYGFIKMSLKEFESWMLKKKVGRTILKVQQHHTAIPNYSHFKGNNHFELQRSMRRYHVDHRGWLDIGQHLSIFPDGAIVTGRDFEIQPACIYGQNLDSFCIENLGNFEKRQDDRCSTEKYYSCFGHIM